MRKRDRQGDKPWPRGAKKRSRVESLREAAVVGRIEKL
jgi:hypothetical protein